MTLTGAELREKYPAERADVREVLGMLGMEVTDISNYIAFRYPSLEAAWAYAEANKERHGHISHQVVTTLGVFGIVDMTVEIERAKREARDGRHTP